MVHRPADPARRRRALALGLASVTCGGLFGPLTSLPAYADPAVAPAAAAYPEPRTRLLVGLGDSVPAGVNTDDPNFVTLLGQRGSYQVVNRAVGGAQVSDVYAELSDPSLRTELAQATEVVLMVGANDLFQECPVEETLSEQATRDAVAEVRRQFDRLLTAIGEQGTPHIVVVGYWNISTDGAVADSLPAEVREWDRSTTTLLNAALAEVAAEHGAAFVDPSQAYAEDPTALLSDDGNHPNGAGHAALADLVAEALQH